MSVSPPSRGALLIRAGAIFSLAALVGCSSGSSTEPTAGVTIQLTIVSPVAVPVALRVREEVSLSADITNSDGSPRTGLAIVRWSSRSPTVINVTQGGIVRGSAPGQGYVVAELGTTLGTVRDSVLVVVSPAAPPN